jgi:O-antigen polymerase
MSKVSHIIIAVIIISTLINIDYFCNSTLAAYFFYVISTSLLLVFTGIIVTQKKIQLSTINYVPPLLFVALALYYLLQGFFVKGSINTMQVYIFTNSLLLISLTLLLKQGFINAKYIYRIITLAALIEAIICILQYANLLHSQNGFLKVTGSWVNPNVTAMFLTMCIPAILSKILFGKSWIRQSIVIIVCVTLLLLQCRTEIIGVIVAGAIILNNRYCFLQRVKLKYSIIKQIIFISLSLVFIIPLTLYAYKMKQDSADGRKLIWKISATMVAQNPVTGIGYGNFEHSYNLEQAKYFTKKNASLQETKNASFVSMAYNEFLQNAVEGGIIALILFITFFISLLVSKKNKIYAPSVELEVSAIAAFVTMSFFNFSIQAIPAMCLFIIFAAIRCTIGTTKKSTTSSWLATSLGIVLIGFGVSIFFSQVSLASSFVKTKEAVKLSNEGYNAYAVDILQPLSKQMENSEVYWISFGSALYNQNQYKQALEKFIKASTITSTPSLYVQIANCYYKQKQFDSAINAYNIAKNISPNRISPRYALMKTYEEMKDTLNAIKTATEIIIMQPKIQSSEAKYYNQEATKLLDAFNTQLSKSIN